MAFVDLLVTIYKNSLSPLSKSRKMWVCCYSKINIYVGRNKSRRLSVSLCPSKPPCSETVNFLKNPSQEITKPKPLRKLFSMKSQPETNLAIRN